MTTTARRRLLFVYGHPDDETIGTGATMARYAAEGAHVALVTCTLGEEGEIYVPELALLAADKADQLGGYRISELRAACQALGVTDQRFLGGAGRYRDSGMMGTAANDDHPRSFWQADIDVVGALLAEIIDEMRPQVIVTFDENGLYGHPDHIQANKATFAALDKASWQVAKVYYIAVPRSVMQRGMETFANSAENPFGDVTNVDDLPFVTDDEAITTRIDAAAYGKAKVDAMRAHATQIPADSWLFTMSENFGIEPMGVEYYILARGERGPLGLDGREADLFAGVVAG